MAGCSMASPLFNVRILYTVAKKARENIAFQSANQTFEALVLQGSNSCLLEPKDEL
ncbi:hypothetical protein EGYY_19800 [Eggerthella sp. YY7918]|nr:hypothetical protein EGYY_19800 [Eggerthella sp. YY7918]